MSYRYLEVGTLARVEPREASERILDAYRRRRGSTTLAALDLGTCRRHLARLVGSLGLRNSVRAIRSKLKTVDFDGP